MKTKIAALLLIVFVGFTNAFAQEDQDPLKYGPDKELCQSNLSIYDTFYKQKNYKDAYPAWKYLFDNAPKRTKNIYIDGVKIMQNLAKDEADPVRKEALIDTLLMVFDNRIKYFPGKEGYVLGQKGALMYKFRKDKLEDANKVLAQSFEIDGNNSSASVINYYFITTTKLVNKDVYTREQLIDLFADLSSVIEYKQAQLGKDIYDAEAKVEAGEKLSSKESKSLKADKRELKTLTDVSNNMEVTLAPLATCEILVDMYTKNFEEKKADLKWLQRAAKLLKKKECTSEEVFFNIAIALYELDPSAPSAALLGIMALKKEDYKKAETFFQQAVDLEKDNLNKAEFTYLLANAMYAQGKNTSARSAALKAAQYRSGWGDPYILIGNMYAGTSRKCGELKTEFLKRVGYWAAIDKYEYAIKIDPSVKAKANKLIATYKPQMPTKANIFEEGIINDKTYVIDCWYHETVKIRIP